MEQILVTIFAKNGSKFDYNLQLGNVDTKNIKVKKISVSFYNLQSESNQLSFDDLCKQRKNQKISGVIDSINKKMGINTISIGINTKTYKSEQIVALGHIPKINN